MKLEGTLPSVDSADSADSADSLHSVPDDELLRRLGELVSHSGRVEVDLVSHVSPCVPLPSRPAVVEPLSPARYKVQFTASAQLHDKLERLQALMRSEVPDGDLAAIIEQAVSEKLERIEARRYASTSAPRKELRDTDTSPTSRHIPAAVRRAVRERDGDRCGYVDPSGRRCSERDQLEFHHRHPFGMGGDHSPAKLRLLCSSHNRYLAERDYGQLAIRGRSVDFQVDPASPRSRPDASAHVSPSCRTA